MSFFISDAMAQGAEQQQAGMLELILPLLLMFGIFYFLLIRPQQKTDLDRRRRAEVWRAIDMRVYRGKRADREFQETHAGNN